MKKEPKLTRKERVALTGKGPAKAHWRRGEVYAYAKVLVKRPGLIAEGDKGRGGPNVFRRTK